MGGWQVFVAVLAAIGIGVLVFAPERIPKGIEPPLSFWYRESLVGAGFVAIIQNDSGEVLRDVQVTFVNEALDQRRSYEQDRLEPGGQIVVGWAGGWRLEAGEKIKVRAARYLWWKEWVFRPRSD